MGKYVCVGELEQSSRPCVRAVQSREPKVVGGVTWVYKCLSSNKQARGNTGEEDVEMGRHGAGVVPGEWGGDCYELDDWPKERGVVEVWKWEDTGAKSRTR